MAGRPCSGEGWPWDWTRDHVQRQIDELLENRDLLAAIETCWPELAWDYAHRMLDRSPDVQSEPVLRTDLERVISNLRAHVPEGDAQVRYDRYGWRLGEGELFVADLSRLNIDEISPPWPAPDTDGGLTWLWWTTEQFLARLQIATKAGLDVYGAIVEQYLPTMAPELSTYQMLPARIVGILTPADRNKGFDGPPRYSWYVEPLPAGSSNEAHWQVGQTKSWADDFGWDRRVAVVRALRGDVAEHTRLITHHGEPQILSCTPAGSLALALLASDLSAFNWTTKSSRLDMNSAGARPRYS